MNSNRFIISFIVVFSLLIFTRSAFVKPPDESNMVLVPAGKFTYHVEYSAHVGYSACTLDGKALHSLITDGRGHRYGMTEEIYLPAFYIDRTEVTNEQFKQFLEATGYRPKWPNFFLKHWRSGTYPKGKSNHPVVWISLEEAKAYAQWAGKRLPTEQEWQKAAQGNDGRIWPWGNNYDPEKANMDSYGTRPVGSYPEGAGPYGCLDMAGNVWEWTDSFSSDGYHLYSWIRGGGYFYAKGSLWYFPGGPITTYQRTKLWHMSPALNRCATVGFRCVKDAE